MKKILALCVYLLIALLLTSCEIGIEIIKVELGKFPDNIVYYANEDTILDLDGCTILAYTRDGGIDEEPTRWGLVDIECDIDFSKPGVYEVKIMWRENLAGRFPVQVIERG